MSYELALSVSSAKPAKTRLPFPRKLTRVVDSPVAAMFCPECKAEYRQGFTRCADCEVPLVSSYTEAPPDPRAWESAGAVTKYSAQLWRGEDPYFYLSLIASLWHGGVLCLGRSARPPIPLYSRGAMQGSSETPEFEVRVDEENVRFARWILDSCEENFEKKDQAVDPAEKKEPQGEQRAVAVSVCPLCLAEFAAGTSKCPNCGVVLRLSQRTSSEDDSSRVLCNLPHPQFFDAIRSALHNAGIPFNNAGFFGHDMILGRRQMPSYSVVVLDSDHESAMRVLAQVLQHWEFEPGSGFEKPQSPLQSYWPVRAVESGWLPEDLTGFAWSGKHIGTLHYIGVALREHEIPFKMDTTEPGMGKILVHPEDEVRARGIVREIVEGPPPE